MEKKELAVFWFRRDLRLEDNCGLYHALESGLPVLPIFIFDTHILDDLQDKRDARLSFIHEELEKISLKLKKLGSKLWTYYGTPLTAFKELTSTYDIKTVYTNRDYEPYARKRDQEVREFLDSQGTAFKKYKDQVIFEKREIVKDNGDPYLVYTPYSKKWLSSVTKRHLTSYPSGKDSKNWMQTEFQAIISLEQMGFSKSEIKIPGKDISDHTLSIYEEERNYPDKDSTSRLGVHLRFGTVSIRQLARKASARSLTYYKELIWREFFMMILFHYPQVVDHNFNAKYDGIKWRNKEADFEKWKKGETGYPLVDAGMRELNSTGFMHNRVRMLVASFLCKHLLIDWKWGEAYFAEKLLDYDLSANNGNWQWAAGTGVDAAPYFRIFNPMTQIDKFDKNKIYIKRWVKDFGSPSYPKEMVGHKAARERALEVYKEGIQIKG